MYSKLFVLTLHIYLLLPQHQAFAPLRISCSARLFTPAPFMPKRNFCGLRGSSHPDVPPSGGPVDQYYLRFDGGSRGNPGIAGSGSVIYNNQGHEVWYGYHFVGSTHTNNQAEYDGHPVSQLLLTARWCCE